MPALADRFDLGRLRLSAGEGRRLALHAGHDPLQLSGERYDVAPCPIPLTLEVSRMTHDGYALRIRFEVAMVGACMRCLQEASHPVCVDAREVDQRGGGEELDSPYVAEGVLDLRGWVRDALALALPTKVLCRPQCAGLCAVCGADLNQDPTHAHEREPDPRWAKLREL